jgi:hypothetical protein
MHVFFACESAHKRWTKLVLPGKVVFRALTVAETAGSSWPTVLPKLGTDPWDWRPERPVPTTLFATVNLPITGNEYSGLLECFTECSAQFDVGWLHGSGATADRKRTQSRSRGAEVCDHLLNYRANTAIGCSVVGLQGVW